MRTAAHSPAIQFLTVLWGHCFEKTTRSWEQLNHGMYAAVVLAIQMGLRFEPDDFAYMSRHFRSEYWAGKDNAKNSGEGFYLAAVEAGNISACQAFEHWRGRKPFLVHGKRLRLRTAVPWHGLQTCVTSFDDAKGLVTLCAYAEAKTPTEGYPQRKPVKRFAVTHAQVRAAFPTKKKGAEATTGEEAN